MAGARAAGSKILSASFRACIRTYMFVQVSVHIADVCAFLPAGCPLDIEAQARATTGVLSPILAAC